MRGNEFSEAAELVVCRAADDLDEQDRSGPFPGRLVKRCGEGTGSEDEGALEIVADEEGEEELHAVGYGLGEVSGWFSG